MARKRATQKKAKRPEKPKGLTGIVRTQRDVAQAFECSANTVRAWVGKGMPGSPGKWDLAAIKEWRDETFQRAPERDQKRILETILDTENESNGNKEAPKLKTAAQRLLEAQARKEEANAEMAERKNEREKADMVSLEAVNAHYAYVFQQTQTQLLKLPSVVAAGYSKQMQENIRSDLEAQLNVFLRWMRDMVVKAEELS